MASLVDNFATPMAGGTLLAPFDEDTRMTPVQHFPDMGLVDLHHYILYNVGDDLERGIYKIPKATDKFMLSCHKQIK